MYVIYTNGHRKRLEYELMPATTFLTALSLHRSQQLSLTTVAKGFLITWQRLRAT